MLGIDISCIDRFEKLSVDDKFLNKVFTKKEIEYFKKRKFNSQTIAGSFSSKEAFFKALGTGINEFSLKDVEILRNENGKPYIELSGSLKDFCNKYGITLIDLSISHDGGFAIAVVILKIDEEKLIFEKCKNKSITDDESVLSYELIKDILKKREADSHKGTYGRALAIGGCIGLTGAAIMCCDAILKSGAGLITLMCAKSLNHIFEIALKEVMTYPLSDNDGIICKENKNIILSKINSSDACVFGCGIGNGRDINSIVRYIVKNSKTPLVIDADGINALSENIDVLSRHQCEIVLTPHLAEFSRLTGVEIENIKNNPKKYAADFASKYNVVLVLKSHKTLVAFPDGRVFENVLGNPGMATGGTGDVLAGIITSFVCQLKDARKASLMGVYLHSLCADIAKEKVGEYSLTPTDIIENISSGLKYLV